MKYMILSFLLVGALADLPRYQPARFRFQRQELAPTTTDSPTEATTEPSGPYAPSGWRPAGEPFTLPNEEPANQYGPPDATNQPEWEPRGAKFELPKEVIATRANAPDNTYGVPNKSDPQSEKLDGPVEVQKSIGTYYVLLPNGQLQKVEFMTENDVQNMKYTARLQLREPAPLLVFRL